MAYEEDQQDDYIPWEPPPADEQQFAETRQAIQNIPEEDRAYITAQQQTDDPENAPPYQVAGGWQPPPTGRREQKDDFVPWEPPKQQQQQLQARGQQPDDFIPWEPPRERPEAEGVIGTAAREAAGATPATLGGLATGAVTAGAGRVIGSTLGRVLGGVAGTWGGPAGTAAGWIGGGLVGGYIGEQLANGIKSLLGFDDSAQRQANIEAHPIAAAAGQVAPLALGLSPGSGAQITARVLSGGIGGAIEGATQLAEGEFSPARLGANVLAGAALPGNRAWLSRLEQRGVTAAGGRLGEAYREQKAAEPPVWPEKTWPEGAPGPTPHWPEGTWPEGAPERPPAPERPTVPPAEGPAPEWPGGLWPNGEPPVRPPEPGATPAEPAPAPADTPVVPHGTPGSEGAAGTAEAKPPPIETAAGPEMTKAGGPEDWGKKTAPSDASTGVNVGDVDQTLTYAMQAGRLDSLNAQLEPFLSGKKPAAEAPGVFRELAETYKKMGQPGQAQKYEQVAAYVEEQLKNQPQPVAPGTAAAPPPRAAAAEARPVERVVGPEPAAVPTFKTAKERASFERGRADAQSGITAKNLQDTPSGRAYQEGVRVEQEKLRGQPLPVERTPANVAGQFKTEPNPAGEGHIITRNGEALPGVYPNKGQAFIAMNRMAREAGSAAPTTTKPKAVAADTRPSAVRFAERHNLLDRIARDTQAGRSTTEIASSLPGRGGARLSPTDVRTVQQHLAAREAGPAQQQQQQQQQQPPRPSGPQFGEEAYGSPPGGKPPSGGQPPRPPPPPPSPGPPPLGAHPLVTAPAVAPARRFETARAAVDKVVRRWQETFQPETVDPMAQRAEPLFKHMKSQTSEERDRIFHATEEAKTRWNNKPEQESYKFISDIENGREVAPELKADAVIAKRMLQEAHELEKETGLKAPYRENYFPHEFKPAKEGQIPLTEHFTQTLGPNWFTKGRTIDLVEHALAAGYELKNSNPFAAIRSRLLAGADLVNQKELLDNLRAMGMAGHLEEGTQARLTRMGYQAINGPDGKRWMLAPEIQPLWKNAISGRGMWSNPNLAGDAFRGWMQFKAFWVPIKLSLSGFHVLHVGHINMASNLARAADQAIAGDISGAIKSVGESITTTFRPKAGSIKAADVQEQWHWKESDRTPEVHQAIQTLKEMGMVPHMAEQLRSDAKTRLDDAWKSMNPFGLAYHGPRELVRRIQAPIFEQWIPRVKVAAALNDAAALLARKPELNSDPVARKMSLSAIGKSIDNRFGEMFYDGLFWNRMGKDLSVGSFLSLGWNLGFAREFGGAALETVTRPAGKIIPGMAPTAERQTIRDATNKIKFASIYMGTAMMIGGMMTKMFTGENPSELNDYIFPKVGGTNPDGSPRRLTTMFYTREIPMLGKHIEEHGGGIGGTLAGMTSMVWNKTLFQPFVELAQNRSYFGSEIWNPNAPGYEQVMQAGRHILGQQFSPMAITGAQRVEETGGQPFEKALSFAGFGPAPAYADRSAIQNEITHRFQQHVAPADRPYQDPDVGNEQRAARNKLLKAIQNKDQPARAEAYKEAIAAGLKPEQLSKLGRVYSDQNMFQRLPQTDQMYILENATPEERQRYWQYASSKTRLQWNKDHPVRTR